MSSGTDPRASLLPAKALRIARLFAVAGMPRRPSRERDFSRTVRLGRNLWVRVTYTQALQAERLPFGADRFVLAGIQHLAIQSGSPSVEFRRAGDLLKLFGLPTDGRNFSRLRARFGRIRGLVIQVVAAESREELDDCLLGSTRLVVSDYQLPRRDELPGLLPVEYGVLAFDRRESPYGVVLDAGFWAHLTQKREQLLVPLALLKPFVNRPLGWDYACFLWSRCNSARSSSVVPSEALLHLFGDGEAGRPRDTFRRLQRLHEEVVSLAADRLGKTLRTRLVLERSERPSVGRPAKRWALQVHGRSAPGG